MASTENSRIVIPFLPSLLHLSSVKIAVHFFYEFGEEVLHKAFQEILQRNLTTSEGSTELNQKESKAKQSLLFIPIQLRETVVQIVHRLNQTYIYWTHLHKHICELKYGEHRLHFRSDGTMDVVQTAKYLVFDERISIKKRFRIACMYCLEESVLALWVQMESSDQMQDFETADDSMAQFWVRWLREGCRVPWTEAAREYLDPPTESSETKKYRFSTFFPLLPPGDRQRFLNHLSDAAPDDTRSCLFTLTETEEERIDKTSYLLLLLLYLYWPYQNLFLEAAEKLWEYLEGCSFECVLSSLLSFCERGKYFNYCELLKEFWRRSPSHLKEKVKNWPQLRKVIGEE